MLVGLIATAFVLVAWLAGLTRRAELGALDLRFRHMSRVQPTGRVLHVDIDDGSLERVGRWPWPRATLAEVVETLHECGADLVVLDIVFPEPQEVRFVDETADLYAGPDSRTMGSASPQAVYDDAIFARVVARTPTIVPMFMQPDAPPPSPLQQQVQQILRNRPDASFDQTLAAMPGDDADRGALAAAYLRARAVLAIERLALPDSAAGALDVPSGAIVPPLAALAAATDTTGFVSFEPDLDGVLRHMPMLARAGEGLQPQLALAAVDALPSNDRPERAPRRARRRADNPLADGALSPAGGGGEIALSLSNGLASRRGQAARRASGSGPETRQSTIAARGRDVVVSAARLQRAIPVDETGRLLINWPSRDVYRRWLSQQHIPAAAVAEVGRMRHAIRRNHALKRLTQLALAKGRSDTLMKLFARADAIAAQRQQARRQRYMAMLYDPANVPPRDDELLAAEQRVEQRIDEAFAAFRRDEIEGFYLAAVPEDPEARKQYDYLKGLLGRIDRIDGENEQKRRFIAAQQARLRSHVAGKVCFIGSTAAAAADFVPTPLGVRMPGVHVHGWIYETIATGRYVTAAPGWVSALVILACGLLTARVAATHPVPFTALASVALAVGYAALNAGVIFAFGGVWLVVVAPLAAMFVSLLAVTGYRQVTEERAKREIRDMFSHALSPALVDRLMEDPDIARLGGQQRSITCLFSDLAGFTSLSERLGPEQTVRLLNRYFDRVTEAIQSRGGGYLNKFLGDGIFCFFGAPVMQDDHPVRAILAAIECGREVRRMNAGEEGPLPGGVTLGIRVGIATGEAMVGNCGSSQRMDYTAIGDSVNLAARLEAANKYFGTDILVSQATWDRAADAGYLARPLGCVLVTGQSEPVGLWNVVGMAGGCDASTREAVADFTDALDAFADRQFGQAIAGWQRVLEHWPQDRPSQIYSAIARHCQATADLDPAGYATQSGKGVDRIVWPWAAGDACEPEAP
jgi:class 3 adenylate cyclase